MGITYDELTDLFCGKDYVIVVCNFEFGTSIIGMDELEVNIDEDYIYLRDVYDTSFKIQKSSVVDVWKPENVFSCDIKIIFVNGNITFIICE